MLVAASAEGITKEPKGLELAELFGAVPSVDDLSETSVWASTSRAHKIDGFVMSAYRSVVRKTAINLATSFAHNAKSSFSSLDMVYLGEN
jgi:hypothetical protein